MKNLFKIILPTIIAFTMVSCMTTSNPYAYNNDPYSQGYSDGYRDGYYQSPDGYWYAPNAVYLDYNNNYYRNGAVYSSSNRNRGNIIISPKRSSLQNRISSGTRSRSETTTRGQDNIGRNQNNIRVQPNGNSGVRNQSQNNRVQPNVNSGMRNQSRNNNRVQPQNNSRTIPQNNTRVLPKVPQENNSQRSSGRR